MGFTPLAAERPILDTYHAWYRTEGLQSSGTFAVSKTGPFGDSSNAQNARRFNYGDGCCPDWDEAVEAYLLNLLTEEQNVAFEDHFLACARCSERLQFTRDYIEAVRRVATRMRGKVATAGA